MAGQGYHWLSLAVFTLCLVNTRTQVLTLCRDELELVLMVDASNSVYDNNFQTMMNSLATLTRNLDVRETALRVGVIVFSTTVSSSPITGNKQQVLSDISRFEYLDESTRTDLGLNEAIRLFSQSRRPSTVPKLLMVVTDGASTRPALTLQAANQAKSSGITIFAIGISDAINRVELQQLASSPSQVMLTPDFNNISKVLNEAVSQACTQIIVPTTPRPTLPPVTPSHLCYSSGSMRSGIGFVSHPWECDKYIQCYYNPSNGLHLGVVRHCPLGLFYNSRTTNCDYPKNVACPNDYCRTGCASYPMADTFRGYWKCKDQRSEGACCGQMETFIKGKGCVKNTWCMEHCKLGDCGKGKCLSRPVWTKDTTYEYRMDQISQNLWFPGTCRYNSHDIVNCACTADKNHFCNADFETTFNSATSLGRYMTATGVTFGPNGASVGAGRYLHLDLHKTVGYEPFTVTMLYRDMLPNSNSVQTLMSSSHTCPQIGGALSVTTTNDMVKVAIMDKSGLAAYASVSLKGLNSNNPQKELTISYSQKELVVSIKVGTVQFVEKTKAPHGITFPCGIDIGPTPSGTGFTGTVQKVSLYSCRPYRFY